MTAQTVLREIPNLEKLVRSDKAHLPPPASPVRLQGRMTPTGYEPENKAWKPFLTRPDPSLGERHDGTPRLAGLDPMKIPPATLIMAGHPNRKQALWFPRLAIRTGSMPETRREIRWDRLRPSAPIATFRLIATAVQAMRPHDASARS